MSEAAQAPQPVEWVPDIPHKVKKLSNMRRVIARRLTESKQTVPHIYLAVDVRLDALLARRTELNEALAAEGGKLSVNDMLVKALALALVEVPTCNVNLVGDKLYSFERADVAVAVSIPGGLVTPIVTEADTRPLADISVAIKEMAARAQVGGLRPEEYNGGCAALSNMGMYGVRQFDAIINPPHGMILAVGAGEERVVPIDGKPAVAMAMTVTGGFDHRAIDGADGAKLMAAFKRIVEEPAALG